MAIAGPKPIKRSSMRKLFVKISVILFLSTFMLWFAAKVIVTQFATNKANQIIEEVYQVHQPTSDDEKIISLTRHVFQNFTNTDPSKDIALRLRGYVTNKRLPSFLRLEDGVIETLFEKGQCDNASRMLAFLLKREGYLSVQWHIVSLNNGHSALLVTLPNDRYGYVDPFFGYIFEHQGQLLNPIEAKDKNKFIPLDEN